MLAVDVGVGVGGGVMVCEDDAETPAEKDLDADVVLLSEGVTDALWVAVGTDVGVGVGGGVIVAVTEAVDVADSVGAKVSDSVSSEDPDAVRDLKLRVASIV